MKKVTVPDNAAANLLGWDPDGMDTGVAITEPEVTAPDNTLVSLTIDTAGGFTDCHIAKYSSGSFFIACDSAPPDGANLDYVVMNFPAYVVS